MKKPVLKMDELKEVTLSSGTSVYAEQFRSTDSDLENLKSNKIVLDQGVIENLNLTSAKIGECNFSECIFKKGSFVGTEFYKSYFFRTEFKGTRFQGTTAPQCDIKDTSFVSCKMTEVSFRFGKFKDVLFEDCDLSGADFLNAQLEKVIFKNCILTDAQFLNAKLKEVNFASSSIENILIDREAFAGVTVNTGQALYLISLFGLRIED